jgi:hypothetical protein
MVFLDISALRKLVLPLQSSHIIRPVFDRMFHGFRSISKGNEGCHSDSVPAAEGIV